MSCVNVQEVRGQVKNLVLARLAALISLAAPQHNNSDGTFSPARWWTERNPGGGFGGERHTLGTGASLSMSGATITVTLSYNITSS